MKIYEWKDGARIKKDPQIIGEYIDSIATKYGGSLSPKVLVDLAGDPENILHDIFLWDDSLAATKYREDQARNLLRNIMVTIEESKGEQIKAFVNIKSDGESVYKPINSVISNPSELKYIIDQARSELSAFVKKYGKYKALAESLYQVKEAINKMPVP